MKCKYFNNQICILRLHTPIYKYKTKDELFVIKILYEINKFQTYIY